MQYIQLLFRNIVYQKLWPDFPYWHSMQMWVCLSSMTTIPEACSTVRTYRVQGVQPYINLHWSCTMSAWLQVVYLQLYSYASITWEHDYYCRFHVNDMHICLHTQTHAHAFAYTSKLASQLCTEQSIGARFPCLRLCYNFLVHKRYACMQPCVSQCS